MRTLFRKADILSDFGFLSADISSAGTLSIPNIHILLTKLTNYTEMVYISHCICFQIQ